MAGGQALRCWQERILEFLLRRIAPVFIERVDGGRFWRFRSAIKEHPQSTDCVVIVFLRARFVVLFSKESFYLLFPNLGWLALAVFNNQLYLFFPFCSVFSTFFAVVR